MILVFLARASKTEAGLEFPQSDFVWGKAAGIAAGSDDCGDDRIGICHDRETNLKSIADKLLSAHVLQQLKERIPKAINVCHDDRLTVLTEL